jgi:hypothetical protein
MICHGSAKISGSKRSHLSFAGVCSGWNGGTDCDSAGEKALLIAQFIAVSMSE